MEAESMRVDYTVCRIRHGRVIPTRKRRCGALARKESWRPWQVFHDGRWVRLYDGPDGAYIITK